MKTKIIKAKVTAEKAIIKQNSVVEVSDEGSNHFLVHKSNGVRLPSSWTVWLRRHEIEILN